jgi:hypothetical protein
VGAVNRVEAGRLIAETRHLCHQAEATAGRVTGAGGIDDAVAAQNALYAARAALAALDELDAVVQAGWADLTQGGTA